MSSKASKPGSAKKSGVPPNQPKISLFLTKPDGSTDASEVSRMRKRSRRNRHAVTPGLILAEITLSSDSDGDGDGVRSSSAQLKRSRNNAVEPSHAERKTGRVTEAAQDDDDVEVIENSSFTNLSDEDDIKLLQSPLPPVLSIPSNQSESPPAETETQPIEQIAFKMPSVIINKRARLSSDSKESDNTTPDPGLNLELNKLPFYEADTQLICAGTVDPLYDDDGNEILSNLDMEEIMKSPLAGGKTGTSSSPSISPIEVGLSSPTTSPSLIRKSPVKVSPKAKATYYSPVKHLRKEPAKRLFGSPSPVKPTASQQMGPPAACQAHKPSTSPLPSTVVAPRIASQFEFLDNFDSVMDEVMSGGEFLFDDADLTLHRKFLCVSRPARCLYLKLFQRTLTWYRQRKVIYEKIAQDLSPLFDELYQAGFFSELKNELPLPDLETLLNLLDKEEMKNLAKDMNMKCGPQSSKEVCKTELLKLAKTQRTLSKIDTCQVLTEAVMTRLAGTFRVSEASRDFLSRVFILYSLPQYWEDETQVGASHLLTMLLTKLGRMEYPTYTVAKCKNIFRNREDVILFTEGLALHSKIQATIETKRWEDVLEVLELVLEKLKESVLAAPSVLEYDSALPPFLRAYTAGSVLTRAAWLGIEAHQKLKQFQRANERIDFLLNDTSKSYLSHYRGRWHERKIVNSKHLKVPLPNMKEQIIQALSDSWVLNDHRLALTARLAKIRQDEKKVRARAAASKNKSKKKRRRNADEVPSSDEGDESVDDKRESEAEEEDDKKLKLTNPSFRTYELSNSITERTIEAEQLSLCGDGERVFGKSTFLGGGSTPNNISSVEDRALNFYREIGYRSGVHGEGSVPISLYGLLFWDIIYMDEGISDVFRGPFQAFPLDLHFPEFYEQRQEKIEEMLHNLRYAWSLTDAYTVMERNWDNNVNKLSIVVWNTFHSLEHAKGLVRSMGLGLLADISERLSSNFRHYRSGFPDLVVWNDKECLFAEVKGPGDKLSAKQSIWLDFLISVGAQVEVCRVKSVSNKRIRV